MAYPTRYERSAAEIEKTLELAGIPPDKLNKTTQVIYRNLNEYDALDNKKKILLLEVNYHLICCMQEGKELLFKSGKNNNVVLCSDSKTFDVKEAKISNSLILLSGLKFADQLQNDPHDRERKVDRIDIERIFNIYFEIQEERPEISELLSILAPSAFNGLENEKDIEASSLYDWNKLREEVQMSDGELKAALSENFVANDNGYYRPIVFEMETKLVGLMLDLMEDNSWAIDEIDKADTYEVLKHFSPAPIFEVLFQKYTLPSPKTEILGKWLHMYDEEKVCQMFAKMFFAVSPSHEYNRFMDTWHIGAPDQMNPTERYLRGIALVIWNSEELRREIVSFPESELSQNIDKRFIQLFRMKDEWTVDEITPYLSRLTTDDMDVTALLTKYARSLLVNNVKYYCSKHGK